MGVILTMIAKICPQTAISHAHISNAVTIITTYFDQSKDNTGQIYRQWAVHGAIIRLVGRSGTWCTVLSNMVNFGKVLFFGKMEADGRARQITYGKRFLPWPNRPFRLPYEHRHGWRIWNQRYEWQDMTPLDKKLWDGDRWFDDLIAAGTLVGENWPFN